MPRCKFNIHFREYRRRGGSEGESEGKRPNLRARGSRVKKKRTSEESESRDRSDDSDDKDYEVSVKRSSAHKRDDDAKENHEVKQEKEERIEFGNEDFFKEVEYIGLNLSFS